MRKQLFFLLLIPAFLLSSCNGGGEKSEDSKDSETKEMTKDDSSSDEESKLADGQLKSGNITLTPVKSKKFPNAKLMLEQPATTDIEAGETTFSFKVENYELKQQSPEAGKNMLANSGKGQHIHFILNNDPYSAHYDPEFTKDLPAGNHVLLAFLSRSFHESVKNENSYIVKQFSVGEHDDKVADLSKPHMFYSRPKGTYSGKDAEKVLLDFFLVNVDLEETGNMVRATVNGQEFMINKWQPYAIEGHKANTLKIKLELLDKGGNLIKSPFNPVSREVKLERDEM